MAALELTDAERQLIEILRQWHPRETYRLVLETVNGAWEIEMSEPRAKRGARGVGTTFDQAWDGMAPRWA